VLYPDGTQEQFPLTQTDVDTYEGSFPAAHQGAYVLRVEQTGEGEAVRIKEGGTVVSFAEEYDLRGQESRGVLQTLAQQTGGRVLGAEDPFFPKQAEGVPERQPLATLLCGIALVLWVLDIALRRIGWEPMVQRWLGMREGKAMERAAMAKSARETSTAQRAKASDAASAAKKEKRAQATGQTAANAADQLLAAKKQKRQM
jgi:hypothetical protein